ncbi:MAG: TlyA family RNA methyltransferase [Oscillospiraceae bacterium]|nr:TlyA family RNA methyltransferase [Oscillospiraceae bacterium]
MRADLLLVEKGFCESRAKARKAIEAGYVFCDGRKITKPAADLPEEGVITLTGQMPFVSRGGEKLHRAMKVFDLSLQGLCCADFGASTGGFTDCMLQAGAVSVSCFDVGHGQLHPSLLSDPRVKNHEGINLHRAKKEEIGCFDFLSADLSFISLTEILPLIFDCLTEDGFAVCLIKPQFEAGTQALNKNGIVKKALDRKRALQRVCEAAEMQNFSVCGLTESPFTGQSGNREYLVLLKKSKGSFDWRDCLSELSE